MSNNQNCVQLFVGNLDYYATEEDVSKIFTSLGVPVEKVRIPRENGNERSKGFAFVDVDSTCTMGFDEIKGVVEGVMIKGRPCRIDRPKERAPRTPGPNREFTAADRQREQQRDRSDGRQDRGHRGGRGGRRDRGDVWED